MHAMKLEKNPRAENVKIAAGFAWERRRLGGE
jgi:hypothetical protein